MTVDEALKRADWWPEFCPSVIELGTDMMALTVLAAEVRRLRVEVEDTTNVLRIVNEVAENESSS